MRHYWNANSRRTIVKPEREPATKVSSGKTKVLHPTKGWRTISDKRARAELILGERRIFPFVSFKRHAWAGKFIREATDA